MYTEPILLYKCLVGERVILSTGEESQPCVVFLLMVVYGLCLLDMVHNHINSGLVTRQVN